MSAQPCAAASSRRGDGPAPPSTCFKAPDNLCACRRDREGGQPHGVRAAGAVLWPGGQLRAGPLGPQARAALPLFQRPQAHVQPVLQPGGEVRCKHSFAGSRPCSFWSVRSWCCVAVEHLGMWRCCHSARECMPASHIWSCFMRASGTRSTQSFWPAADDHR